VRYADGLERSYEAVLNRRSWWITRPYRSVAHFARWVLTGHLASESQRLKRPHASAIIGQNSKVTKASVGRRARALDEKLWGGFSQYALQDLETLKSSHTAGPEEISFAAWALARWHAVQGSYERALENVLAMKRVGAKQNRKQQVQLEANCLIRLGAPDAARKVIEQGLKQWPDDLSFCLAMANSYTASDGSADSTYDEVRLSWINRIYAKTELALLIKADPAQPLAIDNLATTVQERAETEGQAKVSVIIPAYKAQDTLPFALRGLLQQSWQNLEIIIVDDCSPDNTFEIAEDFARRDARVVALRQRQNEGAYLARNKALQIASGELITVHDADDWSHPQKLEIQVRQLSKSSEALGNYSDWVRTSENLRIEGQWRPGATFIGPNISSLLFPRHLLERLGGWDNVRISADTEFLRRMQRLGGVECVERAYKGIPLSFALDDSTNLTRQEATHYKTVHHGVRREYHAAAAHWHDSAGSSDLRIEGRVAARSFPAPGIIHPSPAETFLCDLLLITDFNIVGGSYTSTMNYLRAATEQGMSVAVFHWRRYDLDVSKSLNREIRHMAHEGKLHIVAPGDKVRASTVVVLYPPILHHLVDLCPLIEFEKLIVVVNQMATRLYSGGDVQYDPLIVRENVREAFGVEGAWVPISGLVSRLMESDGRYPRPSNVIWTPLIDTEKWCRSVLRWRGREGKRPKVGRHGRDHYTKWPSTPSALSAAYCVDKSCDVVVLGGAERALAVLRAAPGNWNVQAFGSKDPYVFLTGLDFFIHYPHEDYIEEFGRAPMEAMAVGIPVILPPVFRETFGEAALYAEPGDVWPTIEVLWADEAAYLAQAEAGRNFVLANCGLKQFPARLGRIVGE
jgi:glycosyltransferase involved in cell wall biosynthesis